MLTSRSVPDPGARRKAVPAVALGFFSIAFSAAGIAEPDLGLTLSGALATAEQKGFDALLAEAAVQGAAGDAMAARRLPNPQLTGAYLRSTSVPVPGGETSAAGYAVSAGDQGAIEGAVSGKRSLRVGAAAAALASARSNRDDALRILRFQTARAFFDVLLAESSAEVRRGMRASFAQTLDLVGVRMQYGAASEVDRARVETAKLEADQAVTAAAGQVAQARAALGVWLGGETLEGVALEGRLESPIPGGLSASSLESLRTEAVANRPDVCAARADLDRAEAELDLARRLRIPDVALSAGYARQGPDVAPITPPTLSLGASLELPVFSQRQGEIARAESDRTAARIALDRAAARAQADVQSAWAGLNAALEQLSRMDGGLLDRAREARDLVRYQYRQGAVSLLDLLDAERTALSVELERVQELYAAHVAAAELETAAGRPVTP